MKNLLMVLSLMFVFTMNLHSEIRYVKYDVSGGLNIGTSWANAYTSFQSALTAATSGDQIWVAKGTYKPSSYYDLTNTSRYYHFRMINGVAIYGGFTGTETLVSQRTTYGVGQINETILSGDIGTPNDNTDNCYHVFYHPDGLGLTNSAILDGFTIKGGNANDSAWPHNYGGGMYNYSSSPTITNCTFTWNLAGYGGGMENYSYSSPALTNCTFTSNSAAPYHGGGMCNQAYSSPTLTNCTFTSNSANQYGGGMFNSESSSTLNNCIIWGNDATGNGDELCLIVGTITLNYSSYANATGDVYIASGTFTATNNNITSDPMFVGSTINPAHPYSILGTSPCADAGNDSYNSQDYDIRGEGYPRKLNKTSGGVGTIDMGAYEYKLNVDVLPVELTSFVASVNGATVMLHWQTATEQNNYGFEIERAVVSGQRSANAADDNWTLNAESWTKIGFVEGNGNSNSPKEYSFTDNSPLSGVVMYRLKQIDNDGMFKYSEIVTVETIRHRRNASSLPTEYSLYQNYPNPFNPTTKIKFALPLDSKVVLEVYNIVGQKVTTLINNESVKAGYHQVNFNVSSVAGGLSSGIYIYKITTDNFTSTKKFVLMK